MKSGKVLREIEEQAKHTFLPIIGPEKGKVLVDIVKKYQPKRILEVGTLVGYSTILMSQYLPRGRKIITIEINPQIAEVAKENFKRAGVDNLIDLKVGDALKIIPTLTGLFDLLFLDAAKEEYLNYLKLAEGKLSKNAIVVADNVGMFVNAMQDYLDYVRNSPKFESKTIDFGFDAVEVSLKGSFLN